MASNTANPYTGNIAHNVHPDVVEYFISDYPRADYPAHVNRAIEWNQSLAAGGCRCLHTNGNITVWENRRRGEIITVRMMETPTIVTSPIVEWDANVEAEIDQAAERFYSGK
jgi:hypothetical protein